MADQRPGLGGGGRHAGRPDRAGLFTGGQGLSGVLAPKNQRRIRTGAHRAQDAPGYHGFCVHAAPDVTLEEDLARRDLTINSIAVHADSMGAEGLFDLKAAEFIDPYGGRQDLADKVFRHVTTAFREDPVRILRVARLAARFCDFTVAPETLQLMRDMVQSGEADHLVAERVWLELAKGLMEKTPSRMFEVLRDCG